MVLYKLTIYQKSNDGLVHPVYTYYSDNKLLLESKCRYHMSHAVDSFFGIINQYSLESSELVQTEGDIVEDK